MTKPSRDLKDRHRIRCKGKNCDGRKGMFVWEDQKKEIMSRKCLLCGSKYTELNLVVNNER